MIFYSNSLSLHTNNYN